MEFQKNVCGELEIEMMQPILKILRQQVADGTR
jgi:hypothetical protein